MGLPFEAPTVIAHEGRLNPLTEKPVMSGAEGTAQKSNTGTALEAPADEAKGVAGSTGVALELPAWCHAHVRTIQNAKLEHNSIPVAEEPPWWRTHVEPLEDAELEHGFLCEEQASSNDYSDADNDDENSDEEDMFHMGVLAKVPEEYTKCFLYRWQRAISELTGHLRDDAMLPLDHRAEGEPGVCADAKSGIELPAWHCPFLNYGVGTQQTPCQARAGPASSKSGNNGTYEKEMWTHVCSSHGHILRTICKKWQLQEADMKSNEVQLTLLNGALAEKRALHSASARALH